MRARGRLALLAAVVSLTTVPGCGEEGSDGATGARDEDTATTATVLATTTTLSYRTDVGATPPADAVVVSMKDLKFVPATLRTDSTGVTLALKNEEHVCADSTCRDADWVHDLVVLDGTTGLPLARSERLSAGESGVFVLDRIPVGTYRFFCALHVPASMEGTLEVVA